MDEGVRNVKAILVAKDGVERGTALVPIGKPGTPQPRRSFEVEREASIPMETESSWCFSLGGKDGYPFPRRCIQKTK
jgi:hypothetical protein